MTPQGPRAPLATWLALVTAIGCAPVYTSGPGDGGGIASTRARTDAGPRVENRIERDPIRAEVDRGLADVLGGLVWPLPVLRVASLSSDYGLRIHPVGGEGRFHAGVDIRSTDGAPIFAVADGTVASSGTSGSYGLRVVVDHGAGLSSLYAHASRVLVDEGDRVRRGQAIALVGATGNATGPHLHFELRWGGGTVDPRTVLPRLAGSPSVPRGR